MSDSQNDDIRAVLIQLAQAQLTTQQQINQTQAQIAQTQQQLEQTQFEVQNLTSDVNRVLGRSAILDDVLLQLRENQRQMQTNFETFQQDYMTHLQQYRIDFTENQRSTNAAIERLEAINLRLIEIISRGQN
ncbi:hypothetical protein H6G27_34240 [Nostoc linckia FACHB-104]|nr:hypothetical protein [Nostoc linckia FACHB-104]